MAKSSLEAVLTGTCFKLAVLLILPALLLLGATAYAATPPPSLTGEQLQGTIANLQGTCSSGNFSFDSEGIATGPYGGSYAAHVSLSSSATPAHFPTTYSVSFLTIRFNADVRSIT